MQLIHAVDALELNAGTALTLTRIGLSPIEGFSADGLSEPCAYFLAAGEHEEIMLFWDEVDFLHQLPRSPAVALALGIAAECVELASPQHQAGRYADTIGAAEAVVAQGEDAVIAALLRCPVAAGFVSRAELDMLPLPPVAAHTLRQLLDANEDESDALATVPGDLLVSAARQADATRAGLL